MSALPTDQYVATSAGVEVLSGESHLSPPQVVEVRCQCGHSNCTGNVVMSLDDYEAVRRHPTRFLIKEGHEVADVVRVVDYGTGYVVVAKFDGDALLVRWV